MKIKKKPFYQRPLCRELGAVLLAAAVLCVILLLPEKPAGQPEQTEQSTARTEATGLIRNPLKPQDFVYEGDYMTCLSNAAVPGIDVSVWQGQIDWQQVKAAGIQFAMLRLGYRSMTEGTIKEDSTAQTNYAGATAAQIPVGVYFFSQAICVEEAVAEAEYVLETVKDWKLQMPIVFDWEPTGEDTRTAHVDARTLTDCAKAFLETVQQAGYTAMLYFNTHQAERGLYLEELADYAFWLAQYDQPMEFAYRVDMWQYTDKGSVPGIEGNVDMNLYFIYS